MEVAALKHRSSLRGPTPFLRLQSDERLVALTRRGNQSAYEVLVARYQARLLAFCRHMLASKEDAEDVLQEVFAAAFNAMMADERDINVRPWLYRIARNRSLNHLRKQTAVGVDSMDVHLADHGTTTADRVHKREEFRQLVGDVQELPETQRTALLLREIDALSYEQIAQAMETTVPAIKSLLVRARVSLAEAAEARALSCEEVRTELGEVAEGLKGKTPPVRRHLRTCDRCKGFDKSLQQTNKALAAIFPVGPLLLAKKFLLAQGASSAAGAASAAGTTAAAAGGGAAGAGAFGAGVSVVATKAAAVVAGAAIVTAGAVEVDHSRRAERPTAAQTAKAAPATASAGTAGSAIAPKVVASTPQPVQHSAAQVRSKPSKLTLSARAKDRATELAERRAARRAAAVAPATGVTATGTTAAAATGATGSTAATGGTGATAKPGKPSGPVDTGSDVTILPGVVVPGGTAQPTQPTTTTAPAPAATTPPPEPAPAPAPEPQAAPAPAPEPAPTTTAEQPAPAITLPIPVGTTP